MRRALLVAAVALPATVHAVTAASGQVLETTNYSATNGVSYINAAQCAATDSLHLEWSIIALSSSTFAQDDKYRIYASNKAPTAATGGGTFCAEADDTANGTFADQVGSTTASFALQSLDVSGADAAKAASSTNVTCSATNEGTAIYICAHWYDASGATKKGYAFGTFQVQVEAPQFPTGVALQSGDSSLRVSWTANPSTPTRTDHYLAEAFPEGTAPTPAGSTATPSTPAVATASTNGTSVTIKGLVNNTRYDVVVIAYSVGGNPSGVSDVVTGQPVPSADFWEVYRADGGAEQGGCASGPGGALTLLAAAALAVLRRRKP